MAREKEKKKKKKKKRQGSGGGGGGRWNGKEKSFDPVYRSILITTLNTPPSKTVEYNSIYSSNYYYYYYYYY